MELLERESALAALDEWARDARQGHGRLVLVSGEAGVGKSALVERFWGELPDATRLWGSCDGLFTPRPLSPLRDIAEQAGGTLLEACQARADRDELFTALLRHVGAQDGLHLIAIEDVHWADEATIDLLRFIARRIRTLTVLVVATYRDDELAPTHPLRIALGELATSSSIRRVSLAPLSAQGVRRLAEGSGVDPAELYRLTGGNPFYVTEVMRSGRASVPESARDAVLARVGRLGDQARGALQTAALLGIRVEPALLEVATGCQPSTVDELLVSGLLVGDGPWLRFRHEIARMAVDSTVPAHRRSEIHRAVLAALTGRGSDEHASMAYHAEGAGDAKAALYHAHRAAEHAAALGSHREAAAQYARALTFAAGEDPALHASLHHDHATQLSMVDLWELAAAEFERALELRRGIGDLTGQSETMTRLAQSMWRLCRGSEAIAFGDAAVRVLEPLGPTTQLAQARAELARQHMLHGQHDQSIDMARQAQSMAEGLGLTSLLSEALNTEACAQAGVGGPWAQPLARALEIAIAGGHAVAAGRAYANLHELYIDHYQFDEAERIFTEGLPYCEDRDIATFATCLRGHHTRKLCSTGQWDAAEKLSLELLATPASPINRINPLMILGTVRARRGDASAWSLLDEAAHAADGTAEADWIVPVRLARIEAFWLAGEPTRAREELALAEAVSAQAERRAAGEFEVWRRRLQPDAPAGPRLEPLLEVHRLQLAGDTDRAAQVWLELGCGYEAALALVDGQTEHGQRRALEILMGLGATATARVVRQRMRRLGIRSIPIGARRATQAHPLGLTARERDVLALICDGRTDAEIAQRLVLSVKTVNHHVSAVLAKLGAPTRRAAAQQAALLGLS